MTRARRLPASISSTIAAHGYWPAQRGRSGRLGGPGSVQPSGGEGFGRRPRSGNSVPGLTRIPPGRSNEPVTASRTQRSHAATSPCGFITTPVPTKQARRPARRTASSSPSSSTVVTSAADATRSRVHGARSARSGGEVVRVGVRRELGLVAPVVEQLTHQPGEHQMVGARAGWPGSRRRARRSRCGSGRTPTARRRRDGSHGCG